MNIINKKTNPIINFDITNNNTIISNDNPITLQSINKWNDAKSSNITLYDYGLTMFDIGVVDNMVYTKELKPTDTYMVLNQVGYNEPINPPSGQTSGCTVINHRLNATIIGSGLTKQIQLNGGFFNGFFKLQGYDYELMPPRNNGISIETVIYINETGSTGIFLMLGGRSEDKYNEYFEGEYNENYLPSIYTSNDNSLTSILSKTQHKKAFRLPEESTESVEIEYNQIENIKNNIFSFGINNDKKMVFQYINVNGNLITLDSMNTITNTGFTSISIVSKPHIVYTEAEFICGDERLSDLEIYVNGRLFQIYNNVPELYFKEYNNHPDKLIGVPYCISWGGGSFGLKNSWHYTNRVYDLYKNNNQQYISDNFNVTNTIEDVNDFVLTETTDNNNKVLMANYTGGTSNKYILYYNKPASILPNRNYNISLKLLDNGLFNNNGSIRLIPYNDDVDFEIIDETVYYHNIPIMVQNQSNMLSGEHIYQKNGMLYYGTTGELVQDMYYYDLPDIEDDNEIAITGTEKWNEISTRFKLVSKSDIENIKIGILIESDYELNLKSILINDFKYVGQDNMSMDDTKSNLLIEEYFNKPFTGGLQKLKIYNEVLNNVDILNIVSEDPNNVNNSVKGGRLIKK